MLPDVNPKQITAIRLIAKKEEAKPDIDLEEFVMTVFLRLNPEVSEVIIEEELVASCAEKSVIFRKELNHPIISQVRGEGLLLAVELSKPEFVKYAISHAPDYGIILDYFLFCNNAFRIAPPLIINNDEILTACSQLKLLLDSTLKNTEINEI